MLTDLATVKSWLGITDTASDARLTALIAGVDSQVKEYCNRQFEQRTVVAKFVLDDNDQVVLDEHPVTTIFFAGRGSNVGLSLGTANNYSVSITYDRGSHYLHLIEGMVSTEISILVTDTLQDLAAKIVAAGWSCTVSTGYEEYPAVALFDQQTDYIYDGSEVDLYGAFTPLYMMRTTTPGLWLFPGITGSLVVVYQGGFAPGSLPAGLVLEVNKICCDAWKNMGINGAMKSESVGDYSYTKYEQASVASAIGAHLSALDLWKRV
jgi:hypothetical protein